MENLEFRKLSVAESGVLTQPFTLEEVKTTIWECDSNKSPGPDGITYGFIKHFWVDVKDDFMRFMLEFHQNGRMPKGVNSTFIALISKVDSP